MFCLDNLKIEHRVNEVNLWKDELVNYQLEHALAKLRILNSQGAYDFIYQHLYL